MTCCSRRVSQDVRGDIGFLCAAVMSRVSRSAGGARVGSGAETLQALASAKRPGMSGFLLTRGIEHGQDIGRRLAFPFSSDPVDGTLGILSPS